MRLLMIAAAATLLLLPAAAPAKACDGVMPSAKATSTDYSAETKKKVVKMVAKKKAPKVEYMRAAPM